MSECIFTAPSPAGHLEVRVGWHHDRRGNSSYFGRVWENGDESKELLDVGCLVVDPIPTIAELKGRMGDYAQFLPVDLHIPHDQTSELHYVRLIGDREPYMRHYAIRKP
jgi:hypothetical protein